MQFHLVEDTLNANDIKVEDGKICLKGKPFLHANELSFVGSNTLIKQWSERLNELEAKENKNDDEKREYFELKKNLQNLQKEIINVAKQMARYHGQRITIRLTNAINAFNNGEIKKVSRILAKAPQDGIIALQTYQQATEVQQQSRENVINSIKEIALLASNTMADMETIPSADERVEKAHKLYAQADEMAQAINYDPKEYIELLLEYANFLFECGKYKEAHEVSLRQLALCKNEYGEVHPNTAIPYNNLGVVYTELGEYKEALKYLLKRLDIIKKHFKEEDPETATSYDTIGVVYGYLGEYEKELKYIRKALEIREKILKEHPHTAVSYNNLGEVYRKLGKYNDVFTYHSKALKIFKDVFGEEHPETATSYSNLGAVYGELGQFNDALTYHSKALKIKEKVLGKKHPHTATSYYNLGEVYYMLEKYDIALTYLSNALKILEKALPSEHPKIAKVHFSIGVSLFNLKRYKEAKEHLLKALDIYIKEPSKHQESILDIFEGLTVVELALQRGEYHSS